MRTRVQVSEHRSDLCGSDAAACLSRARKGFTLVELLVAVAIISILGAGLIPGLQKARQKENTYNGQLRIEEIATAMFRYRDANGDYPDDFWPLQVYLDPDFHTAIVSEQPVGGSIFRMRALRKAIEVSTEVDNPMMVTNTFHVTLDEKAFRLFKRTGQLPGVIVETDPVAVDESKKRVQEIKDSVVGTVMSMGDFDAAQARGKLDEAWNDTGAATDLLDQDGDGWVTKSEIYGYPWEDIFIFGPSIRAFIDSTWTKLDFEDGEPDYRVAAWQWSRPEHALLAKAYSDVDDMIFADPAHGRLHQLTNKLDQVGVSLRKAQPLSATREAAMFQRMIDGLVRGGIVSEELGGQAISTWSLFQAVLIDKLTSGPNPVWPPDEPVQLYVDWRAPLHQDATGTEDDPFYNIAIALSYAQELNFTAVEVIVRPGLYRGSLEITRDTRIVGKMGRRFAPLNVGSLVNEGPWAVELYDIWLTSDDEIPGVISVDHRFASTYLENVEIGGALGFAVHQTGGEFRCNDLRVSRTDAFSADMGVAMQFDGGAYVELKNVEMRDNRVGALLLSGPGTRAYVNQLHISKTRANAFALEQTQEDWSGDVSYDFSIIQPGTCAVDVRNGAYLEGEFLKIIGNEYVGLIVHSLGRAVLNNTEISSNPPTSQLPHQKSARNVAVQDNGSLSMTVFTLSHAKVGIYLAGDIEVRLRGIEDCYSLISHCQVGLVVNEDVPPDVELPNEDHFVLYENNEAAIRTVRLSVPNLVPEL